MNPTPPPGTPTDQPLDSVNLLDVLRILLLGQGVGEPGGPSMGMLPFVPGLGALQLRPDIWRQLRVGPAALSPGGFSSVSTAAGKLRKALQAAVPLASARRVPATTPARERLANPLSETPAGGRELAPRQLAMLDEIKAAMQRLLRAGLPAEDTLRPLLPAEQSAALSRRYDSAAENIYGALYGPRSRQYLVPDEKLPSTISYTDTAKLARDLGATDSRGSGAFSDHALLELLVEELVMRRLGKMAPRQFASPLGPTETVRAGLVPRTPDSHMGER